MLTPAATDPNREQELSRQKKNPTAFGTDEVSKLPSDWNEKGGLKEDAKQAAKTSRQSK